MAGPVGGGIDAAVGRGALKVASSTQAVGLGVSGVSRASGAHVVPLVIAVGTTGRRAGQRVAAGVRVRGVRLYGETEPAEQGVRSLQIITDLSEI